MKEYNFCDFGCFTIICKNYVYYLKIILIDIFQLSVKVESIKYKSDGNDYALSRNDTSTNVEEAFNDNNDETFENNDKSNRIQNSKHAPHFPLERQSFNGDSENNSEVVSINDFQLIPNYKKNYLRQTNAKASELYWF